MMKVVIEREVGMMMKMTVITILITLITLIIVAVEANIIIIKKIIKVKPNHFFSMESKQKYKSVSY